MAVKGSALEKNLNNRKTDRKAHRPNEESGPQKKEKDRHLGISSTSSDSSSSLSSSSNISLYFRNEPENIG